MASEMVNDAPGLPHWETLPSDVGPAIRELKTAIRARIEWSGRAVSEVVDELQRSLQVEVDDIVATVQSGETAWPVIDFAEVDAATVSAELVSLVKRRGCLVVRGTFGRDEAEAWDRDVLDYVETNRFFESYSGAGDDFFSSVTGSTPEIYPIYWSPRSERGAPAPTHANGADVLELAVDVGVARHALVRSGP